MRQAGSREQVFARSQLGRGPRSSRSSLTVRSCERHVADRLGANGTLAAPDRPGLAWAGGQGALGHRFPRCTIRAWYIGHSRWLPVWASLTRAEARREARQGLAVRGGAVASHFLSLARSLPCCVSAALAAGVSLCRRLMCACAAMETREVVRREVTLSSLIGPQPARLDGDWWYSDQVKTPQFPDHVRSFSC